jgi:hypothetical protein
MALRDADVQRKKDQALARHGDANVFGMENHGKREGYQGTEKDCDNDAGASLAIHTVSMASATP